MRLGIVLTALIVFLSSLNGCSSKKAIAKNTTQISQIAHSSRDRFSNLAQETEHMDVMFVRNQAKEGIREQSRIISLAYDTMEHIPGISDATPWWGTVLSYGFIAFSVIGVFMILWYLGLGIPIKAVMRMFTSLIPKGKRDAAKLMREAQRPNSKTSVEEAVAVLRATDKDFDAAYRKETK